MRIFAVIRTFLLIATVLAIPALASCQRADTAASRKTGNTTEASASGVTLNYKITGMTCGGCASSIQDTVAALEGVNSCEVSFESGSAIVKVGDAAIAPNVEKAITDLKFTAERIEG
jgi:copper chaperone CopZ